MSLFLFLRRFNYMRAKNRLFNHPVLTVYNDDFIEGIFDLDVIETTINEFSIHVKIHFSLIEPTIERLFENNQVVFAVLIECPKTTERFYYEFNDYDIDIDIPNAKLSDFIRIQSFVISTQLIEGYHSSAFNELFEDTYFLIKPKTILAYSTEIKAKLNFENNNISSIQSIFKIIKKIDFKDDDIQVEKESDFLQIYISERRYNEYMQIKKLTKLNPEIMHATLIIPTLTYVLSSLNKEELDAYDYPWFYALEQSFLEKGINLDRNLLENRSSFELANLLMASPTLTSMSSINQVFQIQMEGDDEY